MVEQARDYWHCLQGVLSGLPQLVRLVETGKLSPALRAEVERIYNLAHGLDPRRMFTRVEERNTSGKRRDRSVEVEGPITLPTQASSDDALVFGLVQQLTEQLSRMLNLPPLQTDLPDAKRVAKELNQLRDQLEKTLDTPGHAYLDLSHAGGDWQPCRRLSGVTPLQMHLIERAVSRQLQCVEPDACRLRVVWRNDAPNARAYHWIGGPGEVNQREAQLVALDAERKRLPRPNGLPPVPFTSDQMRLIYAGQLASRYRFNLDRWRAMYAPIQQTLDRLGQLDLAAEPPSRDQAADPGVTTPGRLKQQTRQLRGVGPPEDMSDHGGFLVGELCDQTGLTSNTVNKYAKLAGVATPGRGKKNHRFTIAEAIQIVKTIIGHSTDRQAKSTCEKFLNELQEIEVKSRNRS